MADWCGLLDCGWGALIYSYQTLIAGGLALLAGFTIFIAHYLEWRRERRQEREHAREAAFQASYHLHHAAGVLAYAIEQLGEVNTAIFRRSQKPVVGGRSVEDAKRHVLLQLEQAIEVGDAACTRADALMEGVPPAFGHIVMGTVLQMQELKYQCRWLAMEAECFHSGKALVAYDPDRFVQKLRPLRTMTAAIILKSGDMASRHVRKTELHVWRSFGYSRPPRDWWARVKSRLRILHGRTRRFLKRLLA